MASRCKVSRRRWQLSGLGLIAVYHGKSGMESSVVQFKAMGGACFYKPTRQERILAASKGKHVCYLYQTLESVMGIVEMVIYMDDLYAALCLRIPMCKHFPDPTYVIPCNSCCSSIPRPTASKHPL